MNARIFDLVTAIVTIPRVLILDELLGAWPVEMQSETRYSEIKSLLPTTSVIFTDHSIERTLRSCDKALVLRPDKKPMFYRNLTEDDKTHLKQEFLPKTASRSVIGQFLRLEEVIREDRLVSSEVDIAFRVCGSEGRKAFQYRDKILAKWTFLQKKESVYVLSGGQRVVLAALLSHSLGKSLDPDELIHLDAYNARLVRFLSGQEEAF